MSISIDTYKTNGLRFWNESQLIIRENFTKFVKQLITDKLRNLNYAWNVHFIEGPILTPQSLMNSSYDSEDIFLTDWVKGNDNFALRAETTSSSYEYAKMLLNNNKCKLPLCVIQQGKSFRKEANDGASANKLRFYEFNQLEFQCIYSNTTKADYREAVIHNLSIFISNFLNKETRIVDSDRLPSYSSSTKDIEVLMDNGVWKEVASCSIRTDFSQNTFVCEFAIGLDRVVMLASKEYY